MSHIWEEEWKKDLRSILMDLREEQFDTTLELLTKIPRCHKTGESKSREKMPQIICEHYSLLDSIAAISDIIERIPRNDEPVQSLLRPHVEKMRKEREKESQGQKRKREERDDVPTDVAPLQSKILNQQRSSQPNMDRNTPSQKISICDVKSTGILETQFIAAKVVQKSGLRTYRTKAKEKKCLFYLGVADETGSIKMTVYGKDHDKKLKEGSSYLFRKLIQDESGPKVTTSSIVSQTRSVDVPEQLEMEAQKLIYPESPVYSIKEAKSAADRTEVTVEGTVTDIHPVEKVKVKHKQEKTKKQTFQLEDETDSIGICMWGDATEQCKGLSPGDVIKVSNMKTKKYYDNISLDSTGYTRIDKVQSVGTHNAKIQVMGIIKATKKETHLEAEFNQQVHTLVVASRLLANAFGFDLKGDFKESLLNKMPLSADAEIQGQKITKITAVEEM
ncbi:uncharacterized protein LOC126388324 isoform X1 [Epinephelus moara]|uniref:uncharacterized protein LOC126388324 isoform X1 n=1 Tax=Epinephelus moara TaxID=300413 RepID=UPI00214F54A9|nr:uncharacterized protein LOC126388324 isoform X1 [Epinephelus moara]